MGSVPSKSARKLPREKPPTWAGSRVRPAAEQARPRAVAFENRNEGIEREAKDPYFMEKLSQLGQVRVDHPMQKVRPGSDVQSMYRSEARASNLRNRLTASSLAELLEARKSVTNSAELESLAKRHHMDVAKLHQLARVVNTPSIDERTVVRTTDQHGEESLTMMARWVDPAHDNYNN